MNAQEFKLHNTFRKTQNSWAKTTLGPITCQHKSNSNRNSTSHFHKTWITKVVSLVSQQSRHVLDCYETSDGANAPTQERRRDTGKLTLTFHRFGFIVSPSGAIFGTCTLIELGTKSGAGLAVIRQGPWTAGTGGVALTTAALFHVLIIAHGATGLTRPVQHQVEETAFWNDTKWGLVKFFQKICLPIKNLKNQTQKNMIQFNSI